MASVAVGTLLWLAPPFHVRPLDERPAPPAGALAKFDAASVAMRTWTEEIPRARDRAIDAARLAAALRADPAAAKSLGRRVGLGGRTFFFVRGEGRVERVESAGVRLDIGVPGAAVLLKTGPVFGNALRDGPGLFDIASHSSFEANALSAELNRLAESRAQPALLVHAKPGARLRFLACGEASSADGTLLLKLVAISTEDAS